MFARLCAIFFLASCSQMNGSKILAVTINDECQYPVAKIVDAYYTLNGVKKVDASEYVSDRMYRKHVVYLRYENELYTIPLKLIENKTEAFGCKVTEVRKVYGKV